MPKPSAHANPLNGDPVLFDMYMSALDDVVAAPEIREALDEFKHSPHNLRASMAMNARHVLETAPQEFGAYEAVRSNLAGAGDSGARALGDLGDTARVLAMILGAIGLVCLVAGVAGIAVWPPAELLVWPGGTLVAVGGLVLAFRLLSATEPGLRLFRGELTHGFGPELGQARNALLTAIGPEEFMAQARTFINTARQDNFSHEYSVRSISGLSEIYDTAYQVSTSTAAELDALLARVDGASIGVAGPRGSGKSTLIRGYCDDQDTPRAKPTGDRWRRLLPTANRQEGTPEDLRCVVSAPVDYAARDFVLHLFAVFCRSVIRGNDRAKTPTLTWGRLSRWRETGTGIAMPLIVTGISFGLPAVVLLHWQRAISRFLHPPGGLVSYAALALAIVGNLVLLRDSVIVVHRARMRRSPGEVLTGRARLHLDQVRYLQTYTSGWSGALNLPGGQAQHSRGRSRAEQPLSYPEIVGEFRAFARDVAAEAHRKGGRVFIGIDELDKIGAPENAERFLNEIKGIFGIPYLYFMVSVSDDALTAFERRGLPLRDAFDSSFDEIIHVEPLSYAESRRLLYRRVIGLSEPYVALCHCLAGGLARDLIRAGRQVVRAGEALIGNDESGASDDIDWIVEGPGTFKIIRDTRPPQPPAIGTVCAAVVRDELRRKARAVAHVANSRTPGEAQDLQDALYDVLRHLVPGAPAIKIVDIACQVSPGESASVTRLRLDFATYAYFCATLQEVFTGHLDTERMVKATSTSVGPGTFDALANARHAFTLDAQLAWRFITQFRREWSLNTREPIKETDGA